MHNYLIRRMLLMMPTLLGITLIVFTIMVAAPGGITVQSLVAGQQLDPQAKKALTDYYNRLYGLDQPAPVQYLRWLNNISPVGFTFDEENHINGFSFWKDMNFGTSFRYGRPALDLIMERIPITLLLNLLSLPLIYLGAIFIGVRAASERGKAFDANSNAVMLMLWSIPTMLAGVLLIGFFANEQYWRWFPTGGLSERAALDMPFLPHWSSFGACTGLILSICAGSIAAAYAGLKIKPKTRSLLMFSIGAWLGHTMVSALNEPLHWLVALTIIITSASLCYAVAKSRYAPLRLSFMLLLGAGLGAIAFHNMTDGEFTRGFLLDRLWHLILPIICLSYGGIAFLAKLTRTAVLENLLADYARTARAKGLPESIVLWRHVFRNSLMPLITVGAALLPSLLAGSVIVETLFSIDGMGKLAVEAVFARDRELVLSITLMSGILTLFGYLIADICYAIADPRVSYE